ncbi:hypothetical protein Hdeb2414_s0002g00072891 [Helianthus debilis subsp. tardiflorus]
MKPDIVRQFLAMTCFLLFLHVSYVPLLGLYTKTRILSMETRSRKLDKYIDGNEEAIEEIHNQTIELILK